MAPLVSIIVPVYNVEAYLENCIRTLVSQTLKEIEIILVDDGSPDNCPSICDSWALKDARIKVVHKENGGLGYARNSGLEIAGGRYVAFVDSDDYVDATMFERLYSASENGSSDAVFCGLRQLAVDGSFKEYCDFREEVTFEIAQMQDLALSFLHGTPLTQGRRMFMSVWHSIYKMDVIQRTGLSFFSEREILSEDLPFQLSFLLNSDKIKFIPDKLYVYRCNPSSLSRNFKVSKFDAALRLRNLIYSYIRDISDGPYYADSEFVDRLRFLSVQLVFSKSFTFREKEEIFERISTWDILRGIDTKRMAEEYSWKYMRPFILLAAGKTRRLILFTVFDYYVNKKNMMFWKH